MAMLARTQLRCSAASAPIRPAARACFRAPVRAKPSQLAPAPFGRTFASPAHYAQQQAARTIKCASAEGDSFLVDADAAELKKSSGLLKSLTFVSFWTQLALSLVSGFILLFSVAVTQQSSHAPFAKWAGFGGVVLGLFSTFFAHGFNRLAKKLQRDEKVSRGWIVKSLLTNNTLNLFGIGSAIIGLQASVGDLVAKSLMTNQGFVYPPVPGSTVASLDIFALQALGNILLCHFISLCFTNLLLRVLNKPTLQAA